MAAFAKHAMLSHVGQKADADLLASAKAALLGALLLWLLQDVDTIVGCLLALGCGRVISHVVCGQVQEFCQLLTPVPNATRSSGKQEKWRCHNTGPTRKVQCKLSRTQLLGPLYTGRLCTKHCHDEC